MFKKSELGSASWHRTIAQEMRLLQYVLSTAKRDPRSVCEAMEKFGEEFLGQQDCLREEMTQTMMDVTDTQVGVICHAWRKSNNFEMFITMVLSCSVMFLPSEFSISFLESLLESPKNHCLDLDVFSMLSTEMTFVLTQKLECLKVAGLQQMVEDCWWWEIGGFDCSSSHQSRRPGDKLLMGWLETAAKHGVFGPLFRLKKHSASVE